MEKIGQRDHDDNYQSCSESQQMHDHCPDTLVFIALLEIENISQVGQNKKGRDNEIVDCILQKGSGKGGDKWKTKSIDNVAGYVVHHDKCPCSKSHDKEGGEPDSPHVFRIEE